MGGPNLSELRALRDEAINLLNALEAGQLAGGPRRTRERIDAMRGQIKELDAKIAAEEARD